MYVHEMKGMKINKTSLALIALVIGLTFCAIPVQAEDLTRQMYVAIFTYNFKSEKVGKIVGQVSEEVVTFSDISSNGTLHLYADSESLHKRVVRKFGRSSFPVCITTPLTNILELFYAPRGPWLIKVHVIMDASAPTDLWLTVILHPPS